MKMALTDRVCVLCVLTLSSAILISSTTTQEPALACVGDMVTVTCDLNVPDTNDDFIALRTNFIVGTSTALTVAIVNGNTTLGGVDLSRLTAEAPVGTAKNVQGTLTLMSYTLADNGLRLGCTIEHNINGNNDNIDSLVETVNLAQAVPPSSPVVTLFQPENSCSTVLMWSPPDSNRSITSYSVFRDSINITTVSSTTTQYTDSDITTVHMYSVVAISCAGDTTSNTVSSESIAVPSSPVVTLSQTDTNCSNTLISWSTPSSDRSVTSYSVYRDGVSVYNGTNTSNKTIDNTQLNISTVYEYSVVAISCAGNSTAVVNTVSIGEYYITSLNVSYDKTSGDTLLNWLISTNTSLKPINSLNYSALFNYTHTRGNDTISSDLLNATFSLPATDTSYNITKYIQPPSFAGEGEIDTEIRVCIHITEQCEQAVTEIIICNFSDSVIQSPEPTPDPLVVIVAAAVGGCCLFSGSVLSLTGVTILIVFVSKKKDPKKRSDTQELQEQTYSQINKGNKTSKQQPVEEKEMEGLYAEMDHTLTKPDNLKRPEPVEEILYSQVQQPMDGPNH